MNITKTMTDTTDADRFWQAVQRWFRQYTRGFDAADRRYRDKYQLKRTHSWMVAREIETIGRQLHLNSKERRLAGMIGLLHDVGRFEQVARYQTFVDDQSVDHGGLGVEVLQRHGVLNDLPDKERAMIENAVFHHNKARLPGNQSPQALFFVQLVRDADKLDIFRVITDQIHILDEALNGPEDNEADVSDAVYRDLMGKHTVDLSHVRHRTDYFMFRIGWLYDINFIPTLRAVQARGYLEKVSGCLPKTRRVADVMGAADAYLKRRLGRAAGVGK